MNTYIKIIIACVFSVSVCACRKYVEDTPLQNTRVLVYTDDYRLLVNDAGKTETASGMPAVFSCDDVDFTAPEVANAVKLNTIYTQMYLWRKPFYSTIQDDYDWNNVYAAMYEVNTVIEGVMDSKNGTLAVRQAILGEALVHRAFAYFTLVNLYAKQYDEKTAATDPGIPLLLKAKLFVDLKRNTVKEIYDQILADTKTAIPFLPPTPDNMAKPSKSAAYALLAKTYLYMRSFGNAAAYADSALAIKSTLADYNTYVATSTYTFPTQFNDKEVILRRVPRSTYGAAQLSAGLLSLLSTNDIRYKLFVAPGSKLSPSFTGLGFYPRDKYNSGDKSAVGLTVPDTWLIKAECFARGGDKDNAIKMVNDLRKLRFSAADYADLTATDAADALRIVIEERRREFFGRGTRWFDQRRLNMDAFFAKPVTRTFDGNTYTLQPGSSGYTFPIAPILIAQNPEIEQNPG